MSTNNTPNYNSESTRSILTIDTIKKMFPIEFYEKLKTLTDAGFGTFEHMDRIVEQSTESILYAPNNASEISIKIYLNPNITIDKSSVIYLNAHKIHEDSRISNINDDIFFAPGTWPNYDGTKIIGSSNIEFKISLLEYGDFIEKLHKVLSGLQKASGGQIQLTNNIWKPGKIHTVEKAKELEKARKLGNSKSTNVNSADIDHLKITDSSVKIKDLVLDSKSKKTIDDFLKLIQEKKTVIASGGHIPKGYIMYGPPGTGKTEIMRALSNESGMLVFKLEKNDYNSMWRGESQEKLKKILDNASVQATEEGKHAIIMIDECDGMLRKKENGYAPDADDLNVLLRYLDGLNAVSNITLFLATNVEKSDIEPSAVRSGRIENSLYLGLPTEKMRKQLFIRFLNGKKEEQYHPFLDISKLAKKSVGLSGADIKKVVDDTWNRLFLDESVIKGKMLASIQSQTPATVSGILRWSLPVDTVMIEHIVTTEMLIESIHLIKGTKY